MKLHKRPATNRYPRSYDRDHETVVVEPIDDNRYDGVDTGDSQEEGTVLSRVVILGTGRRRESSEGNEQGEDDEKETVFSEIGESSDKHREDKGDSPGWDGEELSLDWAVTEGFDDRRGRRIRGS